MYIVLARRRFLLCHSFKSALLNRRLGRPLFSCLSTFSVSTLMILGCFVLLSRRLLTLSNQVDQIIMSKQAGGPKPRAPRADEDWSCCCSPTYVFHVALPWSILGRIETKGVGLFIKLGASMWRSRFSCTFVSYWFCLRAFDGILGTRSK